MAESSTPRGNKRVSIASQACQSCRKKKLRCDEQRPQCKPLNLLAAPETDCSRAPIVDTANLPVSMRSLSMISMVGRQIDQALQVTGVQGGANDVSYHRVGANHLTIYQKLDRIQSNVDQLSSIGSAGDNDTTYTDYREHTRKLLANWRQPRPVAAPSSSSYGYGAYGKNKSHTPKTRRPLTVPHKVLLWPTIRDRMLGASVHALPDLSELWNEGSTWFIKHELRTRSGILPVDMSTSDQLFTSEPPGRRGLFFRDLRLTRVLEYTNAYFDTFNMLFPILSRRRFMDEVVQQVVQEGYPDSSWRGVIALFVFALGQVAIEGTLNPPVTTIDGTPSGIRGGSVQVPPGLHNFNEARRRLNLLPMHDTLEKVQGLLLQAMYFQCSSQHVDYWQSVVSASMVCRVLITCKVDNWESPRGDLIKRAYWTCVLHEELFHVDMDLPGTTIVAVEDDVPLPHFHELQEQDVGDHQRQNEHNIPMAYFLAMITLRRIVGRVHDLLNEFENSGEPPTALLSEMSRQLDAWRNALPPPLRWQDSDMRRVSGDNRMPHVESNAQVPEIPGRTEEEVWPVNSGSGLEMVTAMLQARFYHTQITMHLPFVYRALHDEQPISLDGADNFVAAIRSACDLPLVMAPLRGKKRLVPHHFTWVQSFTGTLLILRVVGDDPQLRSLCEGEIQAHRFKRAETFMLQWLRDIRQVDGIADWSWQVLEPIYSTSRPPPQEVAMGAQAG